MKKENVKNVENKNEKFKRIAEARTNKIVNMIRLLGNCSNNSIYKYSEDDVKKMFSFIEGELKECKARYQNGNNKENKFTWED